MDLTGVNWVLCYDIRDPKRLQRVHRCCKNWGMPLQRSVFACDLSDKQLKQMIHELEELIDERRDDIRIYPIGGLSGAIIEGTSRLPIMLETMLRLQQQEAQADSSAL